MTARTRLRARVVTAMDAVCLALALLPAVTCWIEARLSRNGEGTFHFWSHVFAQLPGPPGMLLRRAFYRLTLDACAARVHVGFGALFTHRQARVETGAYVGAYALVGSAWLREGCLIGSRASLLSGTELHGLDAEGRWTPFDASKLRQIEIGEHAWIGEGAVVMTDVGPGAMVATGAVVSSPVPAGILVAGNPARFVKKLQAAES